MRETLIGLLFAFLAALSFGVGSNLARVGMQTVRVTTGTFISLAGGFLVIFAVALAVDARAIFSLSPSTLPLLALIGGLQFLVGRFLAYNGLRLVGVPLTSAILGTEPLFSAALAITFLGEQIRPLIGGGIVVVVAGLAFSLTAPQNQTTNPGPGGNPHAQEAVGPHNGQRRWRTPFLFGVLSAVIGTIGYGTTTVLARHLVTTSAPPQVISALSIFFGMLFMFGVSIPNLKEDLRLPPVLYSRMIGAGIFSSLAVLFYFTALSRLPVSVASPIVQLKTLISIGIAHVFLKRLDKVTRRLAFGALLVVAGVVMVILGQV